MKTRGPTVPKFIFSMQTNKIISYLCGRYHIQFSVFPKLDHTINFDIFGYSTQINITFYLNAYATKTYYTHLTD